MKITEEGADVFSWELFSPAQAAALLGAAERVPWAPARLYGPERRFEDKDRRRCAEQELDGIPALRAQVEPALKRAVSVASLCWRWPLKAASDTRLVRYGPGDFIATHVDYFPGCGRPHRLVSLICYLNADFAGGETVFPRQRLSVAPRAGKALLFPSGISHPHGTEKVGSGARYALVSWLA